jgi:hypothetical protein
MKKTNGVILMMLSVIVLIAAVLPLTVSCTQNQRAKAWGGKMTITLEPNEKLVNVTWKNEDMWVLTRPMRADEPAETYKFIEKSSFGIMEGEVTIIEKGGSKPVSEWTDIGSPPEVQTFKIN